MKVSYNWLRTYAPVDATPEELADRLTMGGLEVDRIDRIGSTMEGVVIGEVLAVRKHPNADRLTLCEVNLGEGAPVQIVCGAPNVASGQRVPVARVGSTLMLPSRDNPQLKEPVQIRRAKLRGETSEGMICSEAELGLSDDHSGIMVLDEDAAPGTPFASYLSRRGIEASDAVLDVAITPNRPDATSHIGVARDAAALTGTMLSIPPVDLPTHGGETADVVAVEIQAPDACPRYVALLVRGVTVGESPAWLKQRLTAIGLRPRNNVVDVTNFVMLECGQPLHAFDFDDVAGATIRVRKLDAEASFTTLDDKRRSLPAGTLMICDAEREVAIAGVMGGQNSEVTERTTNVLIESAYFDPSSIRRTAKALGLQTDSSYRFERGVDRDGQVWAAARAAQLIAELAGGTIVSGMVDAHPVPFERRVIDVRIGRVNGLLGVPVPTEDARQLLTSIGFEVELGATSDQPTLICRVPSFRPDIEREVDVIEEIARLYGYDNIPEPERSAGRGSPPRELEDDRIRKLVRGMLSHSGYREIYTNSMQRAETAARFNVGLLTGEHDNAGVVETLNPISREMASLRPSLLPGGLEVISFNEKHGQRVLRFFEFGHVFHRTDRRDTLVEGFEERESLLIAVSGLSREAAWDADEQPSDLFDVKGMVESMLEGLRIPGVDMVPSHEASSVTSQHLEVYAGGSRLGIVAELHPEVAGLYDLRDPVYFAEIDFSALVRVAAPHLKRTYRPVSRYPVVERDIAVVVDRAQQVGVMLKAIREAGSALLRDVQIFDLYEGERLGEGKKSVAFSMRFGSDRTLTDEEVDAEVDAVVKLLEREYGASLRG